MQKVPSEVLSFAKAQDFDLASYVMEWEGASVFLAGHNSGNKILCGGYPSFIKFIDGSVSWFDRRATISILQQLA